MDAKTWLTVREWLADLADLPESQWDTYLERHCPDPVLRAEVRAMAANPASLSGVVMAGPALGPGARLGSYEIVEAIDEGGMGEVYRARDTRLGRDVAIKVLPVLFAEDRDRLARFEREAHLLASLNDPHIAQVYGFEDSTSVPALVMELVGGPTLAARIAHGRIPLDEALSIARQIAEALEAAHEQGIIHRDLKPANIKIRADGTVKVLDFGLAKAFDSGPASPAGAEDSPTISNYATQLGVILGTPAYMAPEQARGKPIDTRADIWAFGCVLYEMLTGRRAFGGDDISDTMAAVVRDEPDWTALPNETPVGIRQLLRRCLKKDPTGRLQAIGDARVEITDALAGATEPQPISPPTPPIRWRETLAWSIVALVVVASLGAAVYLTLRAGRAEPSGVVRLEITMPPGVRFNGDATLSPDGKRVAFVGASGGGRQVYLRELDQLESAPLLATASTVMYCFFSPSGKELGFFSAEGVVKRVTLAQNDAVPLLSRDVNGAGAWGPDGQITFLHRDGGLWQMPAAMGGTAKPLTKLDPQKGEVRHTWPAAAGKVILFEVRNQRGESHIEAVSGGVRQILEESGEHPRYLSSGYLLFKQKTDLYAARLDANRLTTGQAFRVLQNVGTAVSVSSNGTLLYSDVGAEQLVWVSRQGVEEPFSEVKSGYWLPALSPRGQHVALTFTRGVGGLWDFDVTRGSLRLLTDRGGYPAWTPDGNHIVMWTESGMEVVDSGTGEAAQPIPGSSAGDNPESVHRDGNTVVFTRSSPDTQEDIYVGSLDGRIPIRPLLKTKAYEAGPQFSPDGRYLAYVSNKTSRSEIYVRPWPEFYPEWPVSNNGGSEPRWSRTGDELFYRSDDRMMSVKVLNNSDHRFSSPEKLFEHPYARSLTHAVYDVAPDGRFLMIRTERRLIVVVNWIEELKARMAAGK